MISSIPGPAYRWEGSLRYLEPCKVLQMRCRRACGNHAQWQVIGHMQKKRQPITSLAKLRPAYDKDTGCTRQQNPLPQ